jgi:hypothetical protein
MSLFKFLLPLVVLAGVGASAAGAAVYLSTREEPVEEVPPSPLVEATPTVTPTDATPTSTPERTPTPLPGGKAPEGCVSSEKAYVDPDGRFAFCYPSDMQLTTVDPGDGTTAVTVQYPADENNTVSATIGWIRDPYSSCIDSMLVVKNRRMEDFSFAEETVKACFQDHYDPSRPDTLVQSTVDFRVFTADGRPVQVLAVYGGPEFDRQGVAVTEIAMRLLDSSVVY